MTSQGVSVVIPVYNRPEKLQVAVESVLNQKTEVPIELIVVDDGSSEEVSKGIDILPLKILRNEQNVGVAAARNIGVNDAKYDWVCFLDSDDYWLPEKLKRQVSFHNSNPHIEVSQTRERWIRDGKFVNPKKKHIPPSTDVSREEFFQRSLELCLISPSSVMISKKVFCSLGGFREEMRVCEDYDLWLRLAIDFQVGLVDMPLTVKFGGHSDQLSKSERAMDRFRVYSIVALLRDVMMSAELEFLALSVLREKSLILLQGAEKRGLSELVDTYSSIFEFANGKSLIPDNINGLLVSIPN